MSKFSIRSILLGIGIGMILTSTLSLIYLAGRDPGKTMTQEEFAKLAGQYGYVKQTEILNGDPKGSGDKGSSGVVKVDANGGETTEKVAFLVEEGDTSEKVAAKLKRLGLIDSEKAFVDMLAEMDLSTRIKVGSFKIDSGSSMKDLIRQITQ